MDGEAAHSSAVSTVETFEPGDCAIVEGCVGGPGSRKLLRFTGVFQNLGTEDLVLGSPEGNPRFKYGRSSAVNRDFA